MKEITKMERDLMTAITHSLAEAIKEGKKLKKLLELYKELVIIKDYMLDYYDVPDDNYDRMEKRETYLKIKIKELENDK